MRQGKRFKVHFVGLQTALHCTPSRQPFVLRNFVLCACLCCHISTTSDYLLSMVCHGNIASEVDFFIGASR